MKNTRYNSTKLSLPGIYAEPCRSKGRLGKVLLTLCLMMASVGAWATDYVFVYNGNYLGVNAAGTAVQNYTDFNPTYCVWTCDGDLGTTSRSLYVTIGGTKRYLTTTQTAGNAVSTTTTEWANWRLYNGYLAYHWTSGIGGWTNNYAYLYYASGWKTSNSTGNGDNNYATRNGNTNKRANPTASSTSAATDNITAPTISYSSRTATTITLNRGNLGGTYTPAATTIVVGGTTYYKGTGANGAYSTTAPSSTLNPTYTWSITSGNASITQAGVVTPNNNITNNITVRLTTTNANPALTKTTDYTINVSSTAATTTYTGGLNAVTPANNSITYNANTGITLDSPARKKNTTAAYQTYTASGNTFYRVNNNFQAAAPTASSTDVALNGYNWTLTAGASNAQLASTTGTTNTLTYNTASQNDLTATVSVTANYAEGGNITKTTDVTLRKIEKCTTPTITLGSDGKVTITAGPGETIYYKTDDSYNNNGTYTVYTDALDMTGRTRIWAYSIRNGYLDSDATNITVADPYYVVPATYDGINLLVDDTYNLTYTLNGPTAGEVIYDHVVYASADPTIATVNQSGKITALKAGTTKVTLTGYKLDGTTLTPVEVNVTVRNPFNDPTSMAVNSTNQTLNQGDTWQIVATAYGTEPVYQKFKYEVTGASGIVSVDETGLVKALSQGNTQITVTAYNYGDVLSAQTQTINITVQRLTSIDGKTCIYDLREITNAAGSYILMDDISASNGLNITFTGTFDGDYHTISGLNSALFSSISGGTVKNVRLAEVNISDGTDVGVIANTATNGAKIYNNGVLSGSVSGSRYVGGLVGAVSGSTKVVNNYNYATVSGVTYAAGIVGYVHNPSGSTEYASQPLSDGMFLQWDGYGANANVVGTPACVNNIGTAATTVWGQEGVAGRNYADLSSYSILRLHVVSANTPRLFFNRQSLDDVNVATITVNTTSPYVRIENGYWYVDLAAIVVDQGYAHLNSIKGPSAGNTATVDEIVLMSALGGVAVTNNMMYGDMTNGTNRSPVYGGYHVDNIQKANEYNYYRSRANLTYTAYNEQGAIDKDEFLTRFPFYRHIMNTHRELAAIKLFGSRSDANVNEIGHWVLDTKVAPYPIIEKWETNTKRTTVDIAANLPNTSDAYAGKLLTEMGSGGYLNVTVNIGGSSRNVRLPITDMDTLRYDFTWGKVVLPFANEFDGWTRDYSKVITGWKITSITGGTTGTLTNYNFADRDCTAKDLYSNSGYIFAQGGNYIVPYGVTAITIEANFAKAYYLRDASYDVAYNATYAGATAVSGYITGQYHGQDVYTDLNTLLGAMDPATTPHTQAIVLVGNYHYNQNTIGGNLFGNYTTKGLTIMSCDEDNNQEPDYGWYSYHTTDRTDIAPVRFDFVPNIGIGMAARVKGSTPYPSIGIWHGHGWFELTETCVSFMSECEINSYSFNANDDGKGNNRWIANSGYFIQIVRARDGNCTKLSYIQIGGNAYVEQLYPGSHTDQARSVTIRPIIVNGGEIEECYMTGYRAGATATGSDIYFWSAGGKMHKWLAAYAENPTSNGVNVTAKVDHAIIGRFFGGGTSTSARITGNIDITMNNSLVDFYCGGPEFGDMADGKKVTTHAKGTTFGEYYGGGFGGTSITINREAQGSGVNFGTDKEFDLAFTNYTSHRLQNGTYGIGVNYNFEYILYSGGGGTGVSRFYTGYANYSLAQTGNVTNELEDCIVLRDYFGGGCQGKVAGTVTSTLTNCEVKGNAFGGGYKPAETTVDVYPTTQPTYSRYTKETGLFSDFGTVAPETFTWVQRGTAGADAGRKELYTTVNMSESGQVTGDITITVKGGNVAGNVFGGGNESASLQKTTVIIDDNAVVVHDVYGGANKADVGNNSVVNVNSGTIGNVFGANNVSGTKDGNVTVNINQDNEKTTSIGNVYGGGNLAAYTGSPDVNMQKGTVTEAIYGGGLGASAVVTGNPTVNVSGGKVTDVFGGGSEANTSGNTTVNVTGGTTTGSTYGGGALANVSGSTTVSLTGGTVHDVYGGGLGRQAADGIDPVAAIVEGGANVTLDGSVVTGNVFGANNLNGTPKGHVKVTVLSTASRGVAQTDAGTRNTPGVTATFDVAAVYGGGNQAAYEPTSNDDYSEVWIQNCDNSIAYVYGGGNAAPVPGTKVTIYGAEAIDNVFGGGNGKTEPGEPENPGANVGYKADNTTEYGPGTALTYIYGGTINNVFGGSNTKGLIRTSADVFLDERKAPDSNELCLLKLGEVYGSGNEAEMYCGASLNLGCITGLDVIYGGAKNATVGSDIVLNITSGTFGKVFGGNNLGGTINGSITVNIDETGCYPVIIGELYGCGNLAAYETPEGKSEPTINIISCTSIGKIFGAGLGDTTGQEEKATVTGNPVININQIPGKYAVDIDADGDGNPDNNDRMLGSIGTVFGGGNAAKVVGTTNVNIATVAQNKHIGADDASLTTVGANIIGNVYGGGNQADVTGKTNVVIGR